MRRWTGPADPTSRPCSPDQEVLPRQPAWLASIASICTACATLTGSISPACADSLTVSWTAPSKNTDGSPLTDLAGYRIYSGCSNSGQYEREPVVVNNAAATSETLDDLSGTCHIAATAVNEAGIESDYSAELVRSFDASLELPGKATATISWAESGERQRMAITAFTVSDYLRRAATVMDDYPVFLSAWGYRESDGTHIVMAQGQEGSSTPRRWFMQDSDFSAGGVERVLIGNDATLNHFGEAKAASPANAWFNLSGSVDVNDRWAYLNGADGGARIDSSATVDPGVGDVVRIGIRQDGQSPWDGGLAEISIWDIDGFSGTDRDDLAAKLATLVEGSAPNPLAVNAETGEAWTGRLVAYWRLNGTSDLADLSGNGHDLTEVGELSNFASHPPVDAVPAGGETVQADSTLHGHSAENVALVQGHVLQVDDSDHGHAAGSVALTQANLLDIASASHEHSADNTALIQQHLLAVQSALHDQAAESITLQVAGALDVQSALHAHSGDSLGLHQASQLSVDDASHSQTADAVELSTALLLNVAAALHQHGVDNVTLSQSHILAVANALHAHAAANITLLQSGVLAVDDSSHAHTADSVAMTVGHLLEAATAIHAQQADTISITQAHRLVVSSALHQHLVDTLALRIPGLSASTGAVFVVEAGERIFVVAAGDRIFHA